MMDAQQIISSLGSAGIVVYFIQWLKNNPKFAFIGPGTKWMSRALGAVLAGAASVGITTMFDSTTGTLTITGLTTVGIAKAVWAWANQMALQEMAYDATLNKRT